MNEDRLISRPFSCQSHVKPAQTVYAKRELAMRKLETQIAFP